MNEWDVLKTLEFAGLSKNQNAQRVIRETQRNSLYGEYFIARLIYAYERASADEGRGIKAPELYTLQHYQETPLQIYLRLARRSPGELLDSYEDGYLSRLPEDECLILFAACKRGMQALLDNLAPAYDSEDEDTELEEEPPMEEYWGTGNTENETAEDSDIIERQGSEDPRIPLAQPGQTTSDPLSSQLDPSACLQSLHAQEAPAPPLDEKRTDPAVEDRFSIAHGAQISTELYETWAAAMRAIRDQMHIGYNTFLAGAALAGCEIEGHSCRLLLQLPNEKRDIKRNGLIYPRFANAAEAILAEHFQTERAELQLF